MDSRGEDEDVEDRLDGRSAGHDELKVAHVGGWRRTDGAWVRIRFSRLEYCRASKSGPETGPSGVTSFISEGARSSYDFLESREKRSGVFGLGGCVLA